MIHANEVINVDIVKVRFSSNCKKTAGPSAPADPPEEEGYGSFSARRTPDVPGFLIL